MMRTPIGLVVAGLLAAGAAHAGVNAREYLARKKAKAEADYRARQMEEDLYENARVVGVGENLGRDKKATTLNYVLYGGRVYQPDGRPTLLLHKIERAKSRGGGPFSSGQVGGDSFIITYPYVEPDEIYLQGSWLKILEFDNVRLVFTVLEGRPPISQHEKIKEPNIPYSR